MTVDAIAVLRALRSRDRLRLGGVTQHRAEERPACRAHNRGRISPKSGGPRMSDDYVREKLGAALDALAVSAAPIQTRLADAAKAMVSLGADDFAGAEERALFGEI